MTILVWDNEDKARRSLNAINKAYGCPLKDRNGYRMYGWASLMSKEGSYGFVAPLAIRGKKVSDLMNFLEKGWEEYENYDILRETDTED